jgi:tRNA(His) guanylyltransferase
MHNDTLGTRMKDNYENRFRYQLTRRIPVIIRVDGRAFHTLTQGCEPFDLKFSKAMTDTAIYLCNEIQGVKCVYKQSDEISLLLVDYDLITTQAWFDYNLQKIVSISAALASVKFTELFGKFATFDSRAFNIPIDEVCNYFIWRQKDWLRNSIEMLAQSHF